MFDTVIDVLSVSTKKIDYNFCSISYVIFIKIFQQSRWLITSLIVLQTSIDDCEIKNTKFAMQKFVSSFVVDSGASFF